MSYAEAMEEAIAFGWIDSRGNRLDAERFKLVFTPRKPGGVWAPSNKARVARLTKEGRMAPAGLAAVARARKDGSWSFYDDIEKMRYPADFKNELARNKKAREFFDGAGMTYRKQALYWIMSAKREETRAKRIAEVVRLAAAGKKADWYYGAVHGRSPGGLFAPKQSVRKNPSGKRATQRNAMSPGGRSNSPSPRRA